MRDPKDCSHPDNALAVCRYKSSDLSCQIRVCCTVCGEPRGRALESSAHPGWQQYPVVERSNREASR